MRLIMKSSNKTVVQNKRGRPPTGQDPVSAIRLPHKLTAAVDDWAAHNGATSRSEAIRRLVELGLAASHPLQRRSFEAASKALDLASQQIDKLIDPSTSDEERKTRKQRLLKGPTEFRDIRGDLAKPKS
jgi:Arc/MetJ-type ribon-helix-helix transcriptional regulator